MVTEQTTDVSVPAMASGGDGLRSIPSTVKTSWSNGFNARSNSCCVKTPGAVSCRLKETAIGLDVALRPVGMNGTTQGRYIN